MREKREERQKEFLSFKVSFFLKGMRDVLKKKQTETAVAEVKNLKEKKNFKFFLLSNKNHTTTTTQREKNHFKASRATRYLLPSSSTHKNKTDFREKEEKSRRSGSSSGRIERRAEVNDPVLQIDGVDFNPVESDGVFRPKETVTKKRLL